jgi:predicted GIY-YIG superfamily endonuclease
MKYYVYTLINEYGIVEYVGCCEDPKRRLSKHKCKPKMYPSGKFRVGEFYRRKDITMEIVKECDTKDEARTLEGEIKLSLGFEWTEQTRVIKGGQKNKESGHMSALGNIYGPIQGQKMKELYSKPVLAFRKDSGEFVGEYPSQMECARQLGVRDGNVSKVIRGIVKSAGGYTFQYATG